MHKIIILSKKDIIVCNAVVYKPTDNQRELYCDILLIMPEFDIKNFKINTKIAIIYGDTHFDNLENIKFDQLITYGMSSKNTVTISSVYTNEVLIAVQREIYDINGNILEIGEHLSQKINDNDIETLTLSLVFLLIGK